MLKKQEDDSNYSQEINIACSALKNSLRPTFLSPWTRGRGSPLRTRRFPPAAAAPRSRCGIASAGSRRWRHRGAPGRRRRRARLRDRSRTWCLAREEEKYSLFKLIAKIFFRRIAAASLFCNWLNCRVCMALPSVFVVVKTTLFTWGKTN